MKPHINSPRLQNAKCIFITFQKLITIVIKISQPQFYKIYSNVTFHYVKITLLSSHKNIHTCTLRIIAIFTLCVTFHIIFVVYT